MSDILPIGAAVAGYSVEGVVGRGGMGVVYRAMHPQRAESVALKVITPGGDWDEAAQALFEREARLAAAVAHRHILPVYEAGSDDGRPFVAMRLERCDLGKLVHAEGRLGAAHAVRLVGQIAAALDAAHAHGLVHRDVKPQNVLLGEEDGRECAYVSDFGVARAAFSGSDLLVDASLVGTIGYASPEQIRGEPVDQRGDVYALGVLSFELLTGRLPFAGRGSLATMWAHLHDEPPLPTMLRPELPAGLDAVLMRALAKRPEDRFGSAGALAAALSEAVNGRSSSAPTTRERSALPTGTVTFLFTDVEGSTKLLHELGAEAYAEELAEHRRLVREACESRGGVEVDTQGDAFFFAFASAPQALAAATEAQSALRSTSIRVRIGIHSGEPHVTSEGYVGIDVHRAARIAASAHGGQVVCSEQVAALLADASSLVSLGAHRLKDFDEPVTIYQADDGSFPALKTIANTNLPVPVSSFLGREEELYEADLALQEARILTIHGPGGQGKTRFALELARRAREERFSDYADGVFSCFLAPLRDPALVLGTIAQTLSVSEQPGRSAHEILSEALREKKLLLFLDNAEHVLACAPELSALAQACPRLTLLVTSRELMRIAGELAFELPPLAEAEGVELFCERAQVAPSPVIAEICARLEGLPLAIELAAARLRLLSEEQLLERLSQRLDLFKGSRDADPRQQTLRATIEWSYDLLTEEEQPVFRALSVFRGGCTLEAAEEVCEADLDTLESLLDKSLLRRRDTEVGPRFWMLETIREYARERLDEASETDALRERHADHFLAFAEEHESPLMGGVDEAWVARFSAETDNLRAAIAHLAEQPEPERELRLAGSLFRFWPTAGLLDEGRTATAHALARDSGNAGLRTRVLYSASLCAIYQGEPDAAERFELERLELARTLGDDATAAVAMNDLGVVAADRGDYERAARFLEESVALAESIGDKATTVAARGNLGYQLLASERYGEARDTLAALPTLDDPMAEAHVRGNLGIALTRLGAWDEAAECFRCVLALGAACPPNQALEALVGLAAVSLARGDAHVTARLAGGVDAAMTKQGFRFQGVVTLLAEETWEAGRAALGKEAWEAAFGKGQAMTLEAAVACALEETAE
jgi:predicted ATPase/class 3 adenylate cyclase